MPWAPTRLRAMAGMAVRAPVVMVTVCRTEGDRGFEGVGGEGAEAGVEVLAGSGRWEGLDEGRSR